MDLDELSKKTVELDKRVENLSGRLDELKESGIKTVQSQILSVQDRMNRQEMYIKELLQNSHNDRLSFLESIKNLELSITKLVADSVKNLETIYKHDRDKQSSFNMVVAEKLGQIAVVGAVVWFIVKDLIKGPT